MENASREFTYSKVKELIQHQQEKYQWEFIFMGANIDAAEEAINPILLGMFYAYLRIIVPKTAHNSWNKECFVQ